MNELFRWVDELPADSPDRALLCAGRAAQPPSGSRERTWHALTATLGVAATSVAATAQASTAAGTAGAGVGAAQVASAKGILATIATSLATKAVAVGFAVGIGAIGVARVATHSIQRNSPPAQSAAPSTVLTYGVPLAPTARRAVPEDLAVPATDAPEPSAATTAAPMAPASVRGSLPTTLAPRTDARERANPPTTLPQATTQQGESTPAARSETETTAVPTTSSLAEQARGLARIQRLLDAGNTSEAIRQLEVSFSSSDYASLAEERDALYVQALFRSQRTSQANLWAKRFLQRYPNSPHVERIRRLVEGK